MRLSLFGALLALLQCLQTEHVNAQRLNIGDRLPAIELKNVINKKDGTLSLADLRGKAIIFDFWGHACPSCIKAFPKMDSLQARFGDQLQIIGVNRESKDSTERLFQRFKKIHRPEFPLVCGDTVLSKLFPNNYLPWHAWVDQDGIVQYITDGWNATAENISSFLQGHKLNAATKEIVSDYDYKRSYLGQVSERYGNSISYSSFIGKSIPNLILGSHDLQRIQNGKAVQIFQYSTSIIDLIIIAFSEGSRYNFYQQNKVLFNGENKKDYYYPKDPRRRNEWKLKHAYTYELVLPSSMAKNAYQYMQQDIMRYFNLKVTREKRWIKCYALTLLDKKKKPANVPDKNVFAELNNYDRFLYLNDAPISTLIKILNYPALSYKSFDSEIPPIIDRTGYRGNVSIRISSEVLDSRNIAGFRKALNNYNLDLIKTTQLTTVLIISAKK